MTDETTYGELCVRCNESGEDRRTLWMACLYAMGELGLPFERQFLFSPVDGLDKLTKSKDAIGVKVGDATLNLVSGKVRCDGDLDPRELYTLRVCKDCRAEWMLAIQAWFRSAPAQTLAQAAGERVRPGMIQVDGKTPVRVFGATKSV